MPQPKSKTKWALVVVAVFAGVFWWRLEQSSIVPNAMEKAPSVFGKQTPSAIASETAAVALSPPASTSAAPAESAETPPPPVFTETTSPLLGTIRLPAGALNLPAILSPPPMGSELALPGAPTITHPPPTAATSSFGPAVITPAWHAPRTRPPQKPHAHFKTRAKVRTEPEPVSDGVNEKLDNVLREARHE